jgi:hypothetical protein
VRASLKALRICVAMMAGSHLSWQETPLHMCAYGRAERFADIAEFIIAVGHADLEVRRRYHVSYPSGLTSSGTWSSSSIIMIVIVVIIILPSAAGSEPRWGHPAPHRRVAELAVAGADASGLRGQPSGADQGGRDPPGHGGAAAAHLPPARSPDCQNARGMGHRHPHHHRLVVSLFSLPSSSSSFCGAG